MSIAQTQLTGPIYMPNGVAPTEGQVFFELSSWDKQEGEAVFVSGPYSAPIDENGQFSVDLFTTTEGDNQVVYRMSVHYLDENQEKKKEYIGYFALAGEGPFSIHDLTIESELIPSTFDVLAEIQAYKTAIEGYYESFENLNTYTDQINNNTASIETLTNSQVAGVIAYETKAIMDADLSYDENTIAYVREDSTDTNNGIYRKVGASGSGSWIKAGDLPEDIIEPIEDRQVGALDLDDFFPEELVNLGTRLSGSDMQILPNGALRHFEAGATAFDHNLTLTDFELAEMAAGRDLKVGVRLVTGSFTNTPFIQGGPSGTLVDGRYEIVLDAATYVGVRVIRVRWTANQDTVVFGPTVCRAAQTIVSADSAVWQALKARQARALAEVAGNQCFGLARPVLFTSSGETPIGTFEVSDDHRNLSVPVHGRLYVSGGARGIVRDGDYLTVILELSEASGRHADIGVSVTTAFSGSSNSGPNFYYSDYIFGRYHIAQIRSDLVDSQGNLRPINFGVTVDNRVDGGNPSTIAAPIDARIIAVVAHAEPFPIERLAAGSAALDAAWQRKMDVQAMVNPDAPTDDPAAHIYQTVGQALQRGYGSIILNTEDTSFFNEVGGLSVCYPARITSSGGGFPQLVGVVDYTDADLNDEGDGTFTATLTQPMQNGVNDNVIVTRIDGGVTTFLAPKSSAADVLASADPASHVDVSTKVLTLNEAVSGATYRISAQASVIEVSSREAYGRKPYMRGVTVSYGGSQAYLVLDGAVGVTELCHFSYSAFNCVSVINNGRYFDRGSIVSYAANDGVSTTGGAGTKETVVLDGTRIVDCQSDGLAPHGYEIDLQVKGHVVIERCGKSGFVSITTTGSIKCENLTVIDANQKDVGGDGVAILTANPEMSFTAAHIEGASLTVADGAVGYVGRYVETPGNTGLSAPSLTVREHVTLTVPYPDDGSYDAVVEYSQ